jgi:hypothetical protein
MRNRDVEQLFKMVAVGDEVDFVGERSDDLARIFTPAVRTTVVASAAESNNN